MSTTGFAPAGKARIHFESVGEGRPVVFVHAGVTDSRMWGPQFERVPDGFRFVRLDLRGFGQSALPSEQYSDGQDVLAVMDHLGIDSAVIVGCSVGAEAALEVAAIAPHRLSGLTLIGGDAPGFDPVSDYRSEQGPKAAEAFEAGDFERAAELEAEIWLVGRGRKKADVDPDLFEMFVEMDQAALRTEEERDELRRPPQLETLPQIDVATLIVVGEHDRPQLIEASEHLEAMIEHSNRVIIHNAAHLPSLEQPEAFNQAFTRFLRT